MTSSIGSNPSGQLPTSGPSIQNEQDQPDNCGICLEPMLQDEVIKKIACEHFYHQPCIDQWLKVANTCPQCRQKADPDAPQFRAPEMTRAELLTVVAELDGNQAPNNNQIPSTNRIRNVWEHDQRISEGIRRRRVEMFRQAIALVGYVLIIERQVRRIGRESLTPLQAPFNSMFNGSVVHGGVGGHQIQRPIHESHIPENSVPAQSIPPVNPHPMPLPRLEVDNQDVRNLEVNFEQSRHREFFRMILEWERQRNGILFDVD